MSRVICGLAKLLNKEDHASTMKGSIVDPVKVEPEFVLFFDCPEEELKRRLLNRNQGRADDNPVTIEKRLEVFKESTLPIINYYSSKGKVQKINAQRSVEQVFDDISNVFSKLNPGSRGASTI
ncbi:hypothetical protein OIU78_025886 [Salix suchowensis]|nr:hypothetical protein OIU78_025886 [Salix suchowensis]